MVKPCSTYTICYKTHFVFGMFEKISLLGFQWACAVEHLKVQTHKVISTPESSNLVLNAMWCWAQSCFFSSLISATISRCLAYIRWCLKVMLSCSWSASRVRSGMKMEVLISINKSEKECKDSCWSWNNLGNVSLITSHSFWVICALCTHYLISWTPHKESCKMVLLGVLVLNPKSRKI